MNVALRRPGYRDGAFADLTNCVDFFRGQSVRTLVVLDRRSESEAFFARLTDEDREYVWLVEQGQADIVILEVAHRLGATVILSNDDFAEYQKRYAGLVFNPSRVLGFEWNGSLGTGTVDFRSVREKHVGQALVDTQLLQRFPDIADILFSVGKPEEVDSLIEYVMGVSKSHARPIPDRDLARAYKRSPNNLQSILKMIPQADLSKDCKAEDIEGKANSELYVVTQSAIVRAANPELREYAGKVMCRRHAMFLAAKFKLNPNNDFQTHEELLAEIDVEANKLAAYSHLVDWLENYELIPDIDGKAPMLGGRHMCRKCADLLATSDLFVFDKRYVSTLHPDLGEQSSRPEGRLHGRALCQKHFDEVFKEIEKIEEDAGVRPRSVATEGTTHISLERLLQYASKKRS